MQSKIEALIRLQRLDPVPAVPEVQASYLKAQAMLSALQLKVEVVCASFTSASAGAADTKGGAAPAKGGKGAAAAPVATSANGLLASLEPFSSLFQDISITPLTRLTAILEALQVCDCANLHVMHV